MSVESLIVLFLAAVVGWGVRKVDQVLTAVVRLEEQVSGKRGLSHRIEELAGRSHAHANTLTDHEGRIGALERKP